MKKSFALLTSLVILWSCGNQNTSVASLESASDMTANTKIAVSYDHASCCSGYYSSSSLWGKVSYTNPNLRWGTRVFLRYGFMPSYYHSWENLNEVEAEPMSAYEWAAKTKEMVHGREGFSGTFVFVFRIVTPDQQEIWDKGNDSILGYYSATLDGQVTSTVHDY